ncbi:hypothetical protein AB0467_24270 [Streptomyces sp. NPDC052095]|uniref:hypothetical protein n=1 Tax=unclassified Streptomyces TaxID=2593676 RepID=UPI00344E94E3
MAPYDARRAAELVDARRRVSRGLLDAGIPVGFTVTPKNGAVAEWTVRPVRQVELRVPIHHQHGCARTELGP